MSELNDACVALLNPDPDAPIKVVRMKERLINDVLDSGYRDILLNLMIKDCPILMELQFQLKDILAVKGYAHRIYGTRAHICADLVIP